MQLPLSGLETHPDGDASVNAIIGSNWLALNGWVNPARDRTCSQTGTTLTANASVFSSDDAGATIRFADGTTDTIVSVTSDTIVTMTTSQTKGSQAFELYRTDQILRDAVIRSLTKQPRLLTTDDRKILCLDKAQLKMVWAPSMFYDGTVATTDATQTTLLAVNLTADHTNVIEARIVARRTGGTAGTTDDGAVYLLRAAVKMVGGAATLIGAVEQSFVREDQGAWDATIDVAGTEARLRVTGAANNNISWVGLVELTRVNT